LAVRDELPTGDVDAISFDKTERWLRVTRGRFELVCNFDTSELVLPGGAQRIRIATSDQTSLAGQTLQLAPLSGALLQDT
jgi:hypothetical protein